MNERLIAVCLASSLLSFFALLIGAGILVLRGRSKARNEEERRAAYVYERGKTDSEILQIIEELKELVAEEETIQEILAETKTKRGAPSEKRETLDERSLGLDSGIAEINRRRKEQQEKQKKQWREARYGIQKQWGPIVSKALHSLGVGQWGKEKFKEFSGQRSWAVQEYDPFLSYEGRIWKDKWYHFSVRIDFDVDPDRGFIPQGFTVTSAKGEIKCPLTEVALEEAMVKAFESGPEKGPQIR